MSAYLGQFSGDLTIASTPSNKNSSSCLRFTTVSAPFSSLAGFNCKVIRIVQKELFKPNSETKLLAIFQVLGQRDSLISVSTTRANLDLSEMNYSAFFNNK